MIAAAGDDHVSEPGERRLATFPIDERKHGVAGATRAVRVDRSPVRRHRTLRFGERVFLRAGGTSGREECAVRLLRRVREVTLEAVEEDGRAALSERKGVAPQP